MRKLALITALIALVAASCSRGSSSENTLVVSIEPQRAILEALCDSGVSVVTLMDRGANPETFEPTLESRAALDRADMFFATGALPFEGQLREAAGKRFVDTSLGVTPVYGTHDHPGHNHGHEGAPDPHFWTSPSGLRIMAANMADALAAANPAKAEVYKARLGSLNNKLDSLQAALADRLATAPHHTFAVWHPSLSYFARDFGLRQIVVGQEGKELSARRLRDIIDGARADSVAVFFFQREYDSRQAESLNEAIGSRLVTIDPLAYDWEAQFNLIADELSRP